MLEEEQNQPQIAEKPTEFQEIAEEGEEDGVSVLPDCLIIEILSRLPSTKDAIRTSTLSKRWTHLWTLLPTLIFSFADLPGGQALENPTLYTLLVDKTLTQCRQSKLKRFKVFVQYVDQFESLFNKWIRFATSCNVEELYLDFSHTGREAEFRLDPSLFINSHLTHLTLLGCMLNPIGAISWKNLRSLCISHFNLDGDFILNILSGSPLLETLFLLNSSIRKSESEATVTNISTPDSLSPTQCPQLNLKKFQVYIASYIQFQSQLNRWIRYAIRCNVKEFIIDFWHHGFGYEFMLDPIVFTSSCFTEMKLTGCMINPVGAISWKNLRSLCISSQNLDEDLISNILSGSPVLEYLKLDDCCGYKRLDITSTSVKNLVISGYWNHRDKFENDIIEINAPNILSLTITQSLTLGKLLLLDMSSLVKVNLNYYYLTYNRETMPTKEAKEEILNGFIMSLAHVKELQIGGLCSKAVSRLQAQGFIFPSNVKFHNVVFENEVQGGDHGSKD